MVKDYFANRGIELSDEEAERVERVAVDMLDVNPWSDPLEAICRAMQPPNKGLQADELRRLAKSQNPLRKFFTRLVGWFSATRR